MTNTAYLGGSTDVSVEVRAFTASTGLPKTDLAYNTATLAAKYQRGATGAATSITMATQTSTGAHSDGGFVHKNAGVYRFDIPDAAVAAGADFVTISLDGVTDVVLTVARIEITGANPRSATTDANVVSIDGATSPERSLSWLGLFRLLGAKVAGVTTGGGTTSEVYKGLRNDGTAGKTRITETNDGSNRTARTFDITDD